MPDIYKIFPAIGVARVGNSSEYYLAPDSAGGLPEGDFNGQFRDGSGLMKRQGVKFKVFCYPEAGGDPYEVIPGENGVASIEWTVHLANKKSAWYDFAPIKGEGTYPPPELNDDGESNLRNPNVTGSERANLITDPGPRTLTGPSQTAEFSRTSTPPEGYVMTFPPTTLSPNQIDSLGEIHTDAQGQLIVVGGYGQSGTDLPYPPAEDIDYVNNDNWWDDTSDGPVDATIVFSDGVTPSTNAATAWVAVTPPRFAPEIVSQITMYDVIFDVAVRNFPDYRPDIYSNGTYQTTYQTDPITEVQDILNRAYLYRGVSTDVGNHKFNYGSTLPENVYKYMRAPDQDNESGETIVARGLMPMLAGDGSASSVAEDPERRSLYVTFTATQMHFATQYYNGVITDVPLPEDEPDRLTRVALQNCSGAAFAPGIEMTWFARRPEIYVEPLRLNKRNYTGTLSPDATPLADGLEPGDFTKYMAIPWQADFNECAVQWTLDNPSTSKNWVNWWPAQRPLKVNRDGQRNVAWIGIDTDPNDDYYNHLRFELDTDMVDHWSELGFVLNQGTADSPDFIEVERTYVDGTAEQSKPRPKRGRNKR
ncbi:MAG: hypothetical protein F6K62_14730 [Sphaerospermopsis sp. SIO1G2]|nr:hypothetical protein [Sphaerospermopsis sp. SIO1G1]NET72137.1 hypothetical protein [Sphaerospermopsis sp. SIO1G2]